MTMNGQQEKSSLLREKNGRGHHHHFNVALSQQRQRPKKIWTLHNLIYICGLYILFSKTKSRCTPPKAFELENYAMPTTSSSAVDESRSRIPKIIHQSYKSLSTLPQEWADTPSRWKKLHPTYEYKFWSDDDNRNLIRQYYPWFLDTYQSYPAPIQRADAARYFAVLYYGGIYADMDILPIRHVDPLLHKLNLPDNQDKEMIVAETYNLGLTNALFAAIPNSTVLHQFVKELPLHTRPLYGFERFIPHFAVLLSTGPTRLWIYLNQYRSKIITLNPAGWGQCHQCKQRHCVPQEGSFFETRKGGSWHKWDTRIMNFIFCHVHFCVWGGVCALIWVYYKCLTKRRDLPELLENKDAEQGMQDDVTGKKRKWNMTNTCGSFENIGCMMRILVSQHRFPIFCGAILLLVL
mmetsp:Transcript_22750/g.40751  ORF Transcript_22750/g.40751 Transcript_22750/m.40751 type:complete len:407 (-) Transcript_22750:303-1523(-)